MKSASFAAVLIAALALLLQAGCASPGSGGPQGPAVGRYGGGSSGGGSGGGGGGGY
ncbi:hypothetical protein [Burkholderia pseudomultivorans]|uniref:hypothetical protein n=1 Tax=Burkholderia pseudomultivorans TaxID=1207504 RepID=UPI0018C46AC8|nr:hypothetical protein [Burkholderia pseudomultivorans]